jgi:hypothetical protein
MRFRVLNTLSGNVQTERWEEPMRLARLTASATLVATLLTLSLPVRPQPIPRLGYLCPFACTGPRWSAFLESLETLGYVDGRSITIVYPRETTYDRLEEAAAELVRLKVDVIFAAQDVQAARAAKQATRATPIVMAVSGDPVGLGLVASLARPGGNLTGITYVEDELVVKLTDPDLKTWLAGPPTSWIAS